MNTAYSYLNNTEIKLMEVGHNTVGPSWSSIATAFPFYRIYYIKKGKATIFVHEEKIELLPNRIYFIPAYSIFSAKCENVLDHYWLHFNVDALAEKYLTVFPPIHSTDANDLDAKVFEHIISKLCTNANPLNNDAHAILGKKDTLPVSLTLAIDGLLKYLLSRFLPDTDVKTTAKEVRFLPVLQYIEENFCHKITNEELSKLLYLNPTYFSNLFTKQFGVSPQQYIVQKKLNLAIKMLFESAKTIKEISFACGFESETYFNRQFSNFYGIPPGKYRKFLGNIR